jgi:hypothetical protein
MPVHEGEHAVEYAAHLTALGVDEVACDPGDLSL